MRKFFSIIVPAYHVEAYLENTVKSIVGQDFTDYELILLDDGSTDGTAKLCKTLSEKYPQQISFVRCLHRGVSATRNEGIKRAGGEYILFVDGDDYLSKGALEQLHRILVSGYPDLLCFNFARTTSMEDAVGKTDESKTVISTSDAIAWKLGERTIPCYASCIKRNMIEANHITFDEDLTYVEDALFLFKCMLASESIWRTDSILYFYLQRPGSATHLRVVPSSVLQMEVKAWKRIKELVKKDCRLKQLVTKRLKPIRKGYRRKRIKELLGMQ